MAEGIAYFPVTGALVGAIIAFGCLLGLGIIAGRKVGPKSTAELDTECRDEVMDIVRKMLAGAGNAQARRNQNVVHYAVREETLRFRWLGMLVFQSGMIPTLGIYSCVLWLRYTPNRSLGHWVWLLGPPLLVLILVLLTPQSLKQFILRRQPLHEKLFALIQAETGNSWINKATAAFNFLGGMTGWSTAVVLMVMVECRADPLLKKGVNFDFRYLLFASATFLVSVTLQMFCEFTWASVLFLDEKLANSVVEMASSSAFSYGAMFTVIAGSMFIPVALILKSFETLKVETFEQLFAILAPRLAIPFTRLFVAVAAKNDT